MNRRSNSFHIFQPHLIRTRTGASESAETAQTTHHHDDEYGNPCTSVCSILQTVWNRLMAGILIDGFLSTRLNPKPPFLVSRPPLSPESFSRLQISFGLLPLSSPTHTHTHTKMKKKKKKI